MAQSCSQQWGSHSLKSFISTSLFSQDSCLCKLRINSDSPSGSKIAQAQITQRFQDPEMPWEDAQLPRLSKHLYSNGSLSDGASRSNAPSHLLHFCPLATNPKGFCSILWQVTGSGFGTVCIQGLAPLSLSALISVSLSKRSCYFVPKAHTLPCPWGCMDTHKDFKG